VAYQHHFNVDPDLGFHFNSDPDPAFYFSADPVSDPAPYQSDGDLRPAHPPGFHFEPPGLHWERPRPSTALF
jgi:hypothetical protein